MVIPLSLEDRIAAEQAWKKLKQGDGDKAQKAFLKMNPENPVYSVGLGYVRFLFNDLPSAEQMFKTALERNPDIILAYLGLAQIYQLKGEGDLVYSQYREVLKRDPRHPWVKPRYEAYRRQKTETLFGEARNAVNSGNLEAAKKSLLAVLFYEPESTEAHLSLARIYKQEKNMPSAILHLKTANADDPKNTKILREYAETLYEAEQYGKSLEAFEQLAELDPQSKDVSGRITGLKEKLGVFELPSLYSAIPSLEAVSREDLAALLAVKFRKFLETPDTKPPIIIDIATSWASKFIISATSFGLLEVYDNHTFLPKKLVNRAEMAEALLRLVNFLRDKGHKLVPQISPDRLDILDVPRESYFHLPITRVVAYQIMDLTPQRTFLPEATISGQEAIKILDIVLALI